MTVGNQRFSFLEYLASCGVRHLCSAEFIFIQPCPFLSSDPASSQLDCFVAMQGRRGNEAGTDVKVEKCGPQLVELPRGEAALNGQ